MDAVRVPSAVDARHPPASAYGQSAAEVVAALGTDRRRGLSVRDAQKRPTQYGRNELGAFAGLFRNRWLWGAVGLSLAPQAAVVYVPFLQSAFGTVGLSPGDWLSCAAVARSVVWVREVSELVGRVGRRDRAPRSLDQTPRPNGVPR